MNGLEGIEAVKKASLSNFKTLKQETRARSKKEDSDDGAIGYDSSSSDDAQFLMNDLERLDQIHPTTEAEETIAQMEMDDERLLNKEEMQNQFMKLTTKMASSKNLRSFLSGVQLHFGA